MVRIRAALKGDAVAVEGLGSQTVRVNQRSTDRDGFVTLGTYRLPKGKRTTVTISNKGTQGHVVADAVQFVPV